MENIINAKTENTSRSIANDFVLMENLLNSNLPDWAELKAKGKVVVNSKQSVGLVKWFETSKSISKKHIRNGDKYDLWCTDDFILLQKHPSFFEKLFSFVISLFSIFLYLWYILKNKLQGFIERLSNKLGSLFSAIALPIAFLAFLGDVITIIVELIFSIPVLIFHPIILIKTIVSFPFKIITILFARILWAFLIPMVSKLLDNIKSNKTENLKALLTVRPWIRFFILGFFRVERTNNPFILVPAVTVSQILTVRKSGIFTKGEYLVIVEGDKIQYDFMSRLSSWFFALILPYYWERTVHVLALPKDIDKKQQIIDSVSKTLKKNIESLN